MDRLFRKRTISTKEAHGLPTTPPPDPIWPEKGTTLRKKKKGKEVERSPSSLGQVPRVEVNIRNSLMFPGLSDFSNILPSLSSIPVNSLRDQLANQRQRGGPAITEAEEELLFAEMKDIEDYKQTFSVSPLNSPKEWNGSSQISSTFSSGSLGTFLSESSSTPNLLAQEPLSPPPTSTSFEAGAIRTKSYGFSGSSRMRDDDYIRRVKKSASSRNLSGSTSARSLSVRSDDSEKTAMLAQSPSNPPIQPHPPRERKSMLQALTPAQMKRISAALLEIGGLSRAEPTMTEDEEETLDHNPDERGRYDSNAKSEHSTGSSSVFPYHVSPTTSSFTAALQAPSEPSSPHIPSLSQPLVVAEAARPVPFLTPIKPKPVRHISTPSNDSSQASAAYIPGQPRPVGYSHSPSSTSEPVRQAPIIHSRTTSLARSPPVQQAALSTLASQSHPESNTSFRPPTRSVSSASSFHGSSPAWSPIMTPENDHDEDLKPLCGIDRIDLGAMQTRLILKARAEREALRAEMEMSPVTDVPVVSAPYRATTPDVTETRPIPTSPVQLGNILTVVNRRPAPAPPSPKPTNASDDPEKVRDFEARIAAATAALKRTPSSGAKLERKTTKKGAMVISTPKLLSSSVNLSKIDSAIEPQRGGSKKMSLRWKKFGFKKASISSSELYSPPPSSVGSPDPQILEEPIALAPSATDLNGFKFPHTPPTPASGLRQSELPEAVAPTDPVAKFIAAGRAVGLNDQQLNEMLLANGMRSGPSNDAFSSIVSEVPPRREDTLIRRTLLMPEMPAPSSPSRKPSIRRKPLNLTSEDEKLVAHSPPMRPRQDSGTKPDPQIAQSTPETLGITSEPDRESFVSGALYDLYGSEQVEKGVEIMEYEDGRVVWGVIDALRDDARSEYTHSRQTSYASSHSAEVAPLALRHRDRGASEARPETNLYFTSPTDIGDLIDQLSRDPTGTKGRIDVHQPLTPPSAAPGQFEDAPSPRKTPPAPIAVFRPNNVPAGGFSPKRQKFIRQGLTGHAASPSAASFASSHSGGKPVEDRLQALMDRLVISGATKKV